MKLLTKESDYAVRALMNLARHPGDFVSSRDVAHQERIPLYFLRRILQTMIRRGLVESKEGVAGGVRLKAKPPEIRIVDVIRLFQGDIRLSECMFRRKICSNRGTCVLRKRIARIEQMLAQELGTITIAGLLEDLEVQGEPQGD
jgi:Rrf2 family protein